jgi:hypothetical protein
MPAYRQNQAVTLIHRPLLHASPVAQEGVPHRSSLPQQVLPLGREENVGIVAEEMSFTS